MLVRHFATMAANVVRSSLRSGNWWLPIVIVLLAVSAVLAATVKVAVPTSVYVLF